MLFKDNTMKYVSTIKQRSKQRKKNCSLDIEKQI